ncbi:chromosome segregation protein SMC [Oscillibacter valericigenes]|uniref:chromosome segregation protein SMC n=1 Tax=Oscillibacter valericigenes TaxID=351091 RepID=UPI001F4203B6|nr:chromosome segregation protein SMC [Oscillibacter valericigenes]MCF2664108.1 chromosome segregation protein SMC [Oscillibacter valericigenes]
MYLKALEIQGFKAFPDKTVLNFAEDITAVVGPNGSGKSNISDAIRWVMGEQSAKALRGAKMEDVIFSGTEKRPPVGFAQVTLVIDNTEHIFPTMEESEVSVTRRYYRSGESEYYINRQSVRLKDVTELFMDTGLGREGYSIIGQGKIDEILSAKSGERREIFEEAAGISKFRHRKEEAERKLERTEENLVRINDKIAELELQVEPLRQQSETAKKYLVLRDELRLLEISVWLENLDKLKMDARKLESDLRAAETQRDEARTALDALYAEGEQFGEKMRQKDMEAERIRTEAAQLDGQVKEQESAVAVLESAIVHNRENIDRARRELDETDSRAGGLEQQASEQETRISEIDRQLTELNAALDTLLEQARAAAEQAGGAQNAAESLRAQEAIATAAAADRRAELAAIAAENGQIAERKETVEADKAAAEEQLAETEKQAKSNRRALEDAQDEATAAANIIAGHTLRMEEREKKAAAASEQRVKLTMDVGALDNRIRLLTEMEKEYEGFSKAVKVVMQARGSLRGIHGPVASLMKTDQKYSLAIEIALGAGLQNIVVDREEDAKAAINFLKQRDGGRATFLPLTAIRGDELRERGVEDEFGFVGLASRLVEFDGKYQNIFNSLLGRTVIVEDMDCGIAMARKYRNAFRIVTLDGQVINRGGSMTGGSTSRSAGVLSRAAELKTLNGRAASMHEKLAAAQRDEEAAARELAAARYELETAEAQRRQAEDEVLRLEGSKNHFDILLRSLRDNLENLEGELVSLTGRLTDNAARSAEEEKAVAEQETLAAGFRTKAEEALSGQSELLAQSGALTEEITGRKAELAALTAEREAALRRAADLRQLAADLTGDRTQKEETVRSYQQNIDDAEAEIARRKETLADLAQQGQSCKDRLTALNGEKLALEAERTAQNKRSQDMNEDLLNLERAVSRLEQKKATSAMEEKQILDRLWEDYELSHSDASAIRIELESVPKAARRIGELKRDIKGLGTINIGAIEEFDRVNGRYTYLTEQRNDVEKAKEELGGIIEEITGQMTAIFSEQFKLINESFQTTFTDLFGGGQARLELEDENDILGCGIEIKAQPPGKTLKTISLLSGGEKAFVAIALYFAILKVHPTPFCVMDEIEAALDEPNVIRVARYMRRLSGKTQFIVITHRRGTMEEADVLYGVTMQEQGVSKILTINLNDMEKELKIK